MSLSPATISKAKKLVKDGFVKQESEFEWSVRSSSGGYYKVQALKNNKKFDLHCECDGWTYNQDCSHCEAVRIFKNRKEVN